MAKRRGGGGAGGGGHDGAGMMRWLLTYADLITLMMAFFVIMYAMSKADIRGSLYSHPIGDHGHGAGPLIGLWDRQEGVPGRGDATVLPGTWFSIELNIRTPIPEWSGKELFIGMEEDAAIHPDGKVQWVLRRQDQFHLVR